MIKEDFLELFSNNPIYKNYPFEKWGWRLQYIRKFKNWDIVISEVFIQFCKHCSMTFICGDSVKIDDDGTIWIYDKNSLVGVVDSKELME